ncbi:hypothetical protein [Raoultella terrigena]|uniref:hypothetical protein n=1 Tax=Raoultella terrigena TaxID=577 RepID=UPI001F39FCCF|nr:hypothetical protein [Raoultella terrigena]MCE9900869.1 hypothetical protein [Raoultella terrigena]
MAAAGTSSPLLAHKWYAHGTRFYDVSLSGDICFLRKRRRGGVSWALPVRWAIRHHLITDSDSPQPFSTAGFITGAADELLIRSVSGAERPFTTAEWGLISELEFTLEELKAGKR